MIKVGSVWSVGRSVVISCRLYRVILCTLVMRTSNAHAHRTAVCFPSTSILVHTSATRFRACKRQARGAWVRETNRLIIKRKEPPRREHNRGDAGERWDGATRQGGCHEENLGLSGGFNLVGNHSVDPGMPLTATADHSEPPHTSHNGQRPFCARTKCEAPKLPYCAAARKCPIIVSVSMPPDPIHESTKVLCSFLPQNSNPGFFSCFGF